MKNIIMQAVQGAGKGTVAKLLVEKYGYIHISTGDLLRERRQVDDEIGRIIAETQDSGVFTPAEIVYQVFEERLSQPDCVNYILDGFPRNLEQAVKCDEILTKVGKDDYIVVNLTVPAEELINRITNRRTCPGCGFIYNLAFADLTPKEADKCDTCGATLTKRNDDSDEEAIAQRIQLYHDNAADLLNYYQEKGVLMNFDSTETKQAFAEIEKVI